MAELLFKDEVHQVVGAALEVMNELGGGFLEAVYQEALAIEFGLHHIPFEAQVGLQVAYKDQRLRHSFSPDFVVYAAIIVELKTVKALGGVEEAQLLNYLKASGFRLGLLLNFGPDGKLEWRRLIR